MRIMKGFTLILILSVVICRPASAQLDSGHIGPSGGQVAAGIAAIVGGGIGITYLGAPQSRHAGGLRPIGWPWEQLAHR